MVQSVMKHDFSRVPQADIPRSSFDRSHGYKTTFDAGLLIPVFVEEVLPGDTLNLHMTGFGRMSTPIKPVMDNLFIDSFFFFVPTRLVWSNWQKFNGEQEDPGDPINYLVPQVTAPDLDPNFGWDVGSLGDYFGLPTGIKPMPVSALYFRAYNLIWNEWFRDQNLQDSVYVAKDDGPDNPFWYYPLRRGKRHDYFTSSLPFPQKGAAASLPLGGTAPVSVTGNIGQAGALTLAMVGGTTARSTFSATANAAGPGGTTTWKLRNSGSTQWNADADGQYQSGLQWTQATGTADLSSATATTINSLRQAFQIQRMLERDARGGTRYTEIIRSHFGVQSPDARLQRPEYLGGGSSAININPVAQTGPTVSGQTPLANLAAIGTLHMNGHGFHTSFVEHGMIIGLVAVRADLNYQQGLDKMWSRRTRYDFYWPAFSHLGEQAVLNKEIYAQGTAADDLVFGYQERYAEYRYKPSKITGQFRSTYAQTLDIWHLAQKFTTLPLLNSAFIQDKTDALVDRVSAVPSEPNFLFDAYFNYRCARPMPMYSVPGMMDHF